NPGRFEATVGPNAVDDRQARADFILRDFEHPTLFVEAARANLGGMGVNRNGREPFRGGNVGEVLAEAFFVDGEVVGERQQDRGDHSMWHELGMATHWALLTKRRDTNGLSRTACHGGSEVPKPHNAALFTVPISCLRLHLLRPPMPQTEGPALIDNSAA